MSTVLILADFSGDKASKTTAELATAAARIGAVTAVVLAGTGKGAALAATGAQADQHGARGDGGAVRPHLAVVFLRSLGRH